MRRLIGMLILTCCLTACVGPTITGPTNLHQPPSHGWTKDQVKAHWGIPYRVSYDGDADTWLYRRSYFVTGTYGNHLEADYASVSFYQGKVIGVAY